MKHFSLLGLLRCAPRRLYDLQHYANERCIPMLMTKCMWLRWYCSQQAILMWYYCYMSLTTA